MKRVVIESPLSGDYEGNLEYARACLRDSLLRGEAPIASHALYAQTGILDDTKPDEREMGIQAGFEWGRSAEICVVYTDRGISEGMERGVEWAETCGIPVEYRTLIMEGQYEGERPDMMRLTEFEILRRKRFAEIGKLSEDYRTYVIIVEPSGNVSLAAEGMTFWEMMGIHQFALVRLQNALLLQQMSNPNDPPTRETDDPQRTM